MDATEPQLLSEEQIAEIEAQTAPFQSSYANKIRGLCATVRAAWRDRDRALTPSIVESLRLLDGAGYGKDVPNSMSEMIKKALAANTALREQLAEAQKQIEKQDAIISAYENNDEEALVEAERL